MTNSRNGTAAQEKDPTQLVIRDAGYNREQKLKMISILERRNTLKTTASLRINEVASEHFIACFIGNNTQSFSRVREELSQTLGQA
jgi:hypothetical protein